MQLLASLTKGFMEMKNLECAPYVPIVSAFFSLSIMSIELPVVNTVFDPHKYLFFRVDPNYSSGQTIAINNEKPVKLYFLSVRPFVSPFSVLGLS